MTCRQLSVSHQFQHSWAQAQQTQGVRHSGTGLAYPSGRFLLGQAIFFHKDLITQRFFHRVQVLPLQILNQCQLHGGSVIGIHNHSRHFFQTSQTGCPPTALTCNDLIVAVFQGTDSQRLYNAVGGNGFRQGLQLLRVKILPRLPRVGLDLVYGQQLVGTFCCRLFHKIAHECAKTFPQSFCSSHNFT